MFHSTFNFRSLESLYDFLDRVRASVDVVADLVWEEYITAPVSADDTLALYNEISGSVKTCDEAMKALLTLRDSIEVLRDTGYIA